MEVVLWRIFHGFGVGAAVWCLIRLYTAVWLRSAERLRRKLLAQGINGPSPTFIYGNVPEMHTIQSNSRSELNGGDGDGDFVSHDYASSIFPYFEHWRKQYGTIYTYSTGTRQHLYVNQPELVKELNQSTSLDLGKPSYVTKTLEPMLGNGILRSNGHNWAQQKKVVAPEFFMDKVKGMVGLMVESALPLLKRWEKCIEANQPEIRVDDDFRSFSAEVISRACFGSSYTKGREIFSKLRTLQKAMSKNGFLFGSTASRFFPVRKQNNITNLEREIESLIWGAVEERKRECSSNSSKPKDLMQSLLEGAINDDSLAARDSSKKFIVDNCKNIYFAGHESTAVAASWCVMLLSLYPEWQDRIRTEVAQVCNDSLPDADSLSQMKTLTMVIQEALRLYPPAAFVSREALEDTQLGNICIPKGVCMWTLIPTLHRDPEIWGADANEFKPERFTDGVSKACKFSQAYIPFGVGPRLCLGKNFAMTELKIVLSLIVSRFSFSLSPKYLHSPAYRMIVEPEHGVHIILEKL